MTLKTFFLAISLSLIFSACSQRSPDYIDVSPEILVKLNQLRDKNKMGSSYGMLDDDEARRVETVLNMVLGSVIAGVEENPSKKWVLGQFKFLVEAIKMEDTAVRDWCYEYVARIFRILGIDAAEIANL